MELLRHLTPNWKEAWVGNLSPFSLVSIPYHTYNSRFITLFQPSNLLKFNFRLIVRLELPIMAIDFCTFGMFIIGSMLDASFNLRSLMSLR